MTDYQPSTRISNSSPSLSCEKADIYTIDEFEHGNGALDYPIGLINADEAMFAGILNWDISNRNNYLYTDQTYWTMSPVRFIDSNYAYVLIVSSEGSFSSNSVSTARGVRPVINLKSTVALEGDGSVNTPFKIVGT